MKIIYFIGIVFLLLLACNKNQISQPMDSVQYEQWRSQNMHDYTIDQSRSCYCPYSGENIRITIRSNLIVSVIRISDSSPVTYPYYVTVDSLFGLIRELGKDSVVIRYNKEYGYPEFLDVYPQLHPVDGGYSYETKNLQILK